MGRATGQSHPVATRLRHALKTGRQAERTATSLADDGRGLPLLASNATDGQREDMMGGFCHFLALALHQRHGWKMRGLGEPADEYSSSPWRGLNYAPRHIYCINDDGLPVDVNGVFESEDAIRRFCAHQHVHGEQLISVDVSEQDLLGALAERGYRQPYESESKFVEKNVERLALHKLRV